MEHAVRPRQFEAARDAADADTGEWQCMGKLLVVG
jgi:hypothetical protein